MTARSIALVVALGACGGKQTKPPDSEEAILERQYEACGVTSVDDDQAEDVDACLSYLRAVLDKDTDASRLQISREIAHALCVAAPPNGEGCYFLAMTIAIPGWREEETEEGAAEGYAGDACDAGYQPACELFRTGYDANGRWWFNPAPAQPAE